MAESPVPHPGSAEKLHEYWVHGKGAAKIRWGSPGDFDRCTRQLEEHAHFTPEQAHGYCNLAHHAATGMYPATHAKLEGHGRAQRMSTYTRSFPLEDISVRSGGDGRTVDAYATLFDVPAEIHDEDGEYEEENDQAMYNRALSDAAPQGSRQSWRVGVFYNHGMTIWKTPSDLYSLPVGVPLEIRPEKRGLFTRTRYHKGETCDRILAAIDEGSLTAYSVSGRYLRSTPPVPRGQGFRRSRDGSLIRVRRLEATLREYGPTPFPAYAGAEIVGVRAEHIATMLSTLDRGERDRLAEMIRSGAPLDSPDPDAPDPGLVAEDSRRHEAEMRSGRPLSDPPMPRRHSIRSHRDAIQQAKAEWIRKASR